MLGSDATEVLSKGLLKTKENKNAKQNNDKQNLNKQLNKHPENKNKNNKQSIKPNQKSIKVDIPDVDTFVFDEEDTIKPTAKTIAKPVAVAENKNENLEKILNITSENKKDFKEEEIIDIYNENKKEDIENEIKIEILEKSTKESE